MKESIMIKAIISSYYCIGSSLIPEEFNGQRIKEWIPENPKNVTYILDMLMGIQDYSEEDNFEVWVTTSQGLKENSNNLNLINGKKIILEEYSWDNLTKAIDNILEDCKGEDWNEISGKLAKHFYWEYDEEDEDISNAATN